MPVRTDRIPGEKVQAADINALAVVANGAEATASDAAELASTAAQAADGAYKLPPGGIPAADLAPDATPLDVLGGPTNPITDGTYRNVALTLNYYKLTSAAFLASVAEPGDINMQVTA